MRPFTVEKPAEIVDRPAQPAGADPWGFSMVLGGAALAVLVGAHDWMLGRVFAAAVLATVSIHTHRRLSNSRVRIEQLLHSEARFRAMVQQAADVTLIVDPEGIVMYASPSVVALAARSTAEIEGTSLSSFIHPDEVPALGRFLKSAAEGRPASGEWRMSRGSDWVWTESHGTDLRSEPTIDGVVVTMRDISERRSLEARLTHQAFHDALTHLANRSLFVNRVSHAIARAPRDRRAAAVLFIDLDGFKKVNDSLGHAAGDELLVACAARLATCVRPGDTIARLGGDEFAVLLEGIAGLADAEHIAERIACAVRASFTIHGREIFVGVSTGIAEIAPGLTPDEVLRNADLAMYFAKSRHKGEHAVYAPAMHAELVEWFELEADLRGAIESEQIFVEYQPIMHLGDGRLYGAEALVRWRHPDRGAVPTTRFVAMAEETGLIVPVGRRVLQEACGQAAAWRRDRPLAEALRLSVNLSGRHFQEPQLVSDVQEALRDTSLDARALTLEITESVLMQRSDATLETLCALKALGVRLAIDDFGGGDSSLGYLQRFPIDLLKIDRTFVESVALADRDPVLVRAIIALGHTLGIETIAEGVERREQRDGLRALGCDLGQGWFFAKAIDAGQFASRFLDDARRRPTPDGMRALTPTPAA